MSDISVGTLGGTTTASGFTSTALQNLDKDTFLQLLVAQMKYQNPMDPVDSTEYLSQAAQYASVEQLENMAQSQAELRSMQMVTIATGLVGQEVTAVNGFTGEEITGVVDTVKFGTEPILMVEGAEVPLSAVISVSSAPTTDQASDEPLPTPPSSDPTNPTDASNEAAPAGPPTSPGPRTDTDRSTGGETQTSVEQPTDPVLAAHAARVADEATPDGRSGPAEVPPEGTTAVPNPFSTIIGTPR